MGLRDIKVPKMKFKKMKMDVMEAQRKRMEQEKNKLDMLMKKAKQIAPNM